MKRITTVAILCLVFFVACTFVLPAQMGTLESHAVSKVKINFSDNERHFKVMQGYCFCAGWN